MTTPVSIHGDWAVPSPFRQPMIVCVSVGAGCWAAAIAVAAQIATTPPSIASFIVFSFFPEIVPNSVRLEPDAIPVNVRQAKTLDQTDLQTQLAHVSRDVERARVMRAHVSAG